MNRELISVIEQIGREKGIDKEILFEAVESALQSACRKSHASIDNIRIEIDRKTGEFCAYLRKRVVDEVTDPETEISLAEAKKLNVEAELDVELGLDVQLLGLREADLRLRIGDLIDDPLAQVGTELARLPVDLDANVVDGGVRLPARRLEGRLHRLEEDLLVDPLLPSDLLDDADQLSVHEIRNLPAILRLAGPGDLRLEPRLRDVGSSKLHPLALAVQHQPLGRDRRQSTAHLGAAGKPAPHLPADRPMIFPVLPQLPVEPWRRNLEIVASLDQGGSIEHVTDLPAQSLAVPDLHAARLVNVEPQQPPRPERAPLEVY